MPITTRWYDEDQRIIHCKYVDDWAIEDYYRTMGDVVRLVASVPHRVVVITDYAESGPFPPRLLTAGRQAEKLANTKVIKSYIVGINRYIEVLTNMFIRMFPKAGQGVEFVPSLEEAILRAKETLDESV